MYLSIYKSKQGNVSVRYNKRYFKFNLKAGIKSLFEGEDMTPVQTMAFSLLIVAGLLIASTH